MNNFPTMQQNDSGLSLPYTLWLMETEVAIPHWLDHRKPRIGGDMRRRKRRLREKLAKQDTIRYASAIRAVSVEMKRSVMDKIERDISIAEEMDRIDRARRKIRTERSKDGARGEGGTE